MYRSPLKAVLTEALRSTFDTDYPVADFRDIRCSIEYPMKEQDYPGIWINYADTDRLQTSGIAHIEAQAGEEEDAITQHARWKFTGTASFTVVALSSLERDRLFDEMVRVIAFGNEVDSTSVFREKIETNDFLACNIDFDTVEVTGDTAAPGTPWGSDEVMYECTVNVDIIGEFVSDPLTGDLFPLSAIILTEALSTTIEEGQGEVPEDWTGDPDEGPTGWH